MKIFISHSSQDKWVARQIAKMLELDKHDTFLDEKDIKTGDSIHSEIQKHLSESDHLLILLSPASISSHWVFIEVGGAKALGKKVIPILFHIGSNEIPPAISHLLARDINDLDKYFEELKNAKKKKKESKRNVVVKKSISGFSVGDLVQITPVEHLTTEDKLLSPKWVSSMNKFSGAKTRITGFSKLGHAYLQIDNGKNRYNWNLSWISKVQS